MSLPLGTAYQVIGTNSGATALTNLSVSGTASQVIVNTSGTTVTLSTPQNIASGSSPTFAGLTLTGFSGAISTSAGVLSAGTLSIANGGTGKTALSSFVPTIQKFTTGSGTYTTPAAVTWIKVKMVGGGGGGSGSGTASAGNGGNGGGSTFGTTLLSSGGGVGGVFLGAGGTGGAASLGSGPIGTAIAGGQGTGYTFDGTVAGLVDLAGSPGASSPLGGAGGGGSQQTSGYAGVTNSGSGGGGGGSGTAAASGSGCGGGAGGWVDAIIGSPSVSYNYAIGAAGTAGTAGTNGFAGGAGGSGYIEVEEHYI